MIRLILISFLYFISFSVLKSQVVLEKTDFYLGEVSLLNEDIIDLNLENNTDKRLFIMRIGTEDNVRIKFTSRTIQPGESEMLRIKLNPHEEGKFKTELQLFFGQNIEPIELGFTADILSIPVNQLQACPDFTANRQVGYSAGAYKNQEKGEIVVENVSVLLEEDLDEYLAEKERLALETEKELLAEQNAEEEIIPEEEVEEQISKEVFEEEEIVEEVEELEETEDIVEYNIPEEREAIDPNLLDESYKANNIVFLLDASTSMSKDGKIELLKSSMKELLVPLRSIDKIAIVSYAGEASLLLASTEASDKGKISGIIDSIPADGSTNAVKGLRMALKVAKNNFIEGGNNQIILATDGAFDIGSRNTRLRNKIQKSSNEDIIVSVIGIKNDRWTNKSLREIADLGGGELLRIHSDRNLSVILEEVKEKSLK